MLTELRNRGIADALIVCGDGLKGLPDAIRATWPEANRADLCRASGAEQSALRVEEVLGADHPRAARDLHRSDGVVVERERPVDVAETWREIYPAMISSWENCRAEFVPFLEAQVVVEAWRIRVVKLRALHQRVMSLCR